MTNPIENEFANLVDALQAEALELKAQLEEQRRAIVDECGHHRERYTADRGNE